jgi:putative transposase
MRFRFIRDHEEQYPIRRMCSVLSVSPSGYYAWRQRPPSERELANRQLVTKIRAIHDASRQVYGYRKVHRTLLASLIACGRNRVARLMHRAGLRSRRRRRYQVTTTQSQHRRPVAPNRLAGQFAATAPNQKWVSDITYIRTRQGWLYLAAVLDLFSRRVVGWAMERYLTDNLTVKALEMALARRQVLAGLLHHSDRGSQYASSRYLARLGQARALTSMSRRGNVYDNAPMESFFATLKTELVHHRDYSTRQEAKSDIFEYIEVFYNRQRLHQSLDYRSPADFESLLAPP